jgi:hypothetical protein
MKTERIKNAGLRTKGNIKHKGNEEKNKKMTAINQRRFGMSMSVIDPASLPYRQAPWLNDRRPWTQSRSSS